MSKLYFQTENWRMAEIKTQDFITPEDGQYKVIIEEVKYSEQDKDGNESDPTFIYTFRIMEGANIGQRFRRYTTIRNQTSASYFKGDMQKLGLPIPTDPEELPQIFLSAAGSVLMLTVKTKNINGKDYKDVYFDKLIGKQAVQQPQNAKAYPPQMPAAYQQSRQYTDARAQPTQGFYPQRPAGNAPQAQPPQSFSSPSVYDDEQIPW